jgi:hypothetical protein
MAAPETPATKATVKELTDLAVAKAKWTLANAEAGPKSKVVLRDGPQSILQLRITPNNVKSFCVYYRPKSSRIGKRGSQLKGKQRRITLGQYPDLSLAEARIQADEMRLAVRKGRDPWAERKTTNLHRYTNLWESVAEQFVAKKMEEIKKQSWEKIQKAFKHHVTPKWQGRPITDLGRIDARELLKGIKAKGTAREVRKHLHALFEWAIDEELVAKNPMHERKVKGKQNKGRLAPNKNAGRSLSRNELKAVWHAAEGLGYPFGPWFQLLMLTGQRRADWSAAERSELKAESELEQEDVRTADGAADRYVLEIPARRYKSERDHIVPLVPAAWKIIAGLPKWEGNDYSLFSSRAGKGHISGYSKAKARLDRDSLAALRKADPKATLPPYRVHDLRVSCRTRLASLGIAHDVAEAAIGHAQGGLTAAYNKHDYIALKRAALAKYAKWLSEVVK